MSSFVKYPTINMIKNICPNKLKGDHAPESAPAKIVLKIPHAWVTNNKPTLPSYVIFEISIHLILML